MNKRIITVVFVAGILLFSGLGNIASSKILKQNWFEKKTSDIEYKALIVGIGDYNGDGDYDDDGDLKTVNGCFNGMYNVLNDRRVGFNKQFSKIQTLLDAEATRDNFYDKIQWLKENSDDNDISFIYYSGHGTMRDTIDSLREGNEANDECLALYEGIYRDDHFTDDISQIPGTVVVFLDSCKNHGFVKDLDYIKNSWVSQNIIMFTCHDEHQNNYAVLNMDIALFTNSIISSFMQNSNDSEITVEEFYNNLATDYYKIKDMYGINYLQGANIYPTKESNDYDKVKDIVLLKGINNEKPLDTDVTIDIGRRGNVEISTNLVDPDGDPIDFYVSWGYWGYGGWKGTYDSGEDITKSFQYPESGKYHIIVIRRDSNGACTYWDENNVHVNSKEKLSNFLRIIDNSIFDKLISIFKFNNPLSDHGVITL